MLIMLFFNVNYAFFLFWVEEMVKWVVINLRFLQF